MNKVKCYEYNEDLFQVLDREAAVFTIMIGSKIDWYTAQKEFKNKKHMQNWVKLLASEYNFDEKWALDMFEALVQMEYLHYDHEQCILTRTLPPQDDES